MVSSGEILALAAVSATKLTVVASTVSLPLYIFVEVVLFRYRNRELKSPFYRLLFHSGIFDCLSWLRIVQVVALTTWQEYRSPGVMVTITVNSPISRHPRIGPFPTNEFAIPALEVK